MEESNISYEDKHMREILKYVKKNKKRARKNKILRTIALSLLIIAVITFIIAMISWCLGFITIQEMAAIVALATSCSAISSLVCLFHEN